MDSSRLRPPKVKAAAPPPTNVRSSVAMLPLAVHVKWRVFVPSVMWSGRLLLVTFVVVHVVVPSYFVARLELLS